MDRLKDEGLYKRTLKNYCVATLTRTATTTCSSRAARARARAPSSSELKLGLLGCGLEAYILNLQARPNQPRVFIVPATISYHLVLEAETLIDDYLRDEGKSRYIIDDDEFSRPARIAKFFTALLTMDGQIHVRFGRALDPFGNEVDDDGRVARPARAAGRRARATCSMPRGIRCSTRRGIASTRGSSATAIVDAPAPEQHDPADARHLLRRHAGARGAVGRA